MSRSLAHDTLSRMALVWWGARCGSMRGAHEIQVGPGYVVDAAALGVLFHRHFREFCRQWGMEPKTIRYDLGPDDSLILRGQGDIPDYFSCVFEAKAQRGDFLGTFGPSAERHANRLRPVAHLHWVVTEKDLCTAAEIPAPWGLLQRSGSGLRLVKYPDYCPMTELELLRMSDRLLWANVRGDTYRVVLPRCPECSTELEQPADWKPWEPRHPKHLEATP